MKHIYLLYCAIVANFMVGNSLWGSYYHAPSGPQHESVCAARDRFDRMTVRQMHHVCIDDLTANQKEAFKELATEYFMSEVIRPGCSMQPHRRKYEIMYEKIGRMLKNPCA
jgi:hypothetical protein